jgi:hypothetical protein
MAAAMTRRTVLGSITSEGIVQGVSEALGLRTWASVRVAPDRPVAETV